ncbi:MAG: trypsin-like peptidase domain-containing protein [Kiritimatiellae bacterium]|jgi:prepilin-type processing-associated H-X9-DG protein|nr:trypsin-like peptidase domain-containing protein [Kiritimatiellia bacterium]
MITTNVIHRTFHIRIGDSIATCFTVDLDGKQYLVTAKHVVKDISDKATVSIFHDKQWKNINVSLVGHGSGEIDISVLCADFQLSPTYPLETSMGGIIYGQDVFFLGFPYGMTGELGKVNRNFPLPFVKKAIVSCINTAPNGVQMLFLDGHNNPGFAGGPVIFKEPNGKNFKVAGVICAYRSEEEPIYQGTQKVPLAYRCNTGIIIAYGIKHALDLINNNPIGFKLTS